MMPHVFMRSCYIGFVGCLMTILTIAQTETCPTLVQSVLDSADDTCAGVGRNQVCYVNLQAEITPQDPTVHLIFDQPGDLLNLEFIDTMVMSPLNTIEGTWGVSLMKLQANLPDTQPGQNVTMLLFGDVEIRNEVDSTTPLITLVASSTINANVRATPTTNASVLRALNVNEAITLNGRNADGTWVRLDTSGWVFAELLTIDGDVMTLASVVAGEENPSLNPMQAFYFTSGIGDASCAEAPESGILIQTPSGAQKINLMVNGVDISLGSTAFLQAQPEENLVMAVVEGEGTLTADGETVIVPAGSQASVPLDENGEAIGAPSLAEPYEADKMSPLPIAPLAEDIEIAEPLTEEELDNLTTVPVAVQPIAIPSAMNIPGLSPYCMDLFNRIIDASTNYNLDVLLALESEFENSTCEAEINNLADTYSGLDGDGD